MFIGGRPISTRPYEKAPLAYLSRAPNVFDPFETRPNEQSGLGSYQKPPVLEPQQHQDQHSFSFSFSTDGDQSLRFPSNDNSHNSDVKPCNQEPNELETKVHDISIDLGVPQKASSTASEDSEGKDPKDSKEWKDGKKIGFERWKSTIW